MKLLKAGSIISCIRFGMETTMTRRKLIHPRRDGVTLIELLVVASIMLTIAAVSVPSIKPMMESQATARGAQTVATYLERAKSRAKATRRPCGVVFEYFDGTWDGGNIGSASLVLRQMEVPPSFSGYETTSRVSVAPWQGLWNNGKKISEIYNYEAGWASFVSGEQEPKIQFNYIGPYYRIIKVPDGSSAWRYFIEEIPGVETPVGRDFAYQIACDPRTTMTSPVGMPEGTVVDLEFSGSESNFFAKGKNVVVMFAPTGEVDYVINNGQRVNVADTLYFLIGRWDRISALGISDDGYETMAEDGLWNFEDPTNFWVAVNARTGVVTTAEVSEPFAYTLGDRASAVEESREFARFSKRNLGGR